MKDYALELAEKINEGEIEPDKGLAMVRKVEKFAEISMDLLRPIVVNALNDGFTQSHYFGVEVTKSNRKDYDYHECSDATWNSLQYNLAEIEAKIKDRENYLKSLLELDVEQTEFIKKTLKINPPLINTKTVLTLTVK
jgi:hypothetical protein